MDMKLEVVVIPVSDVDRAKGVQLVVADAAAAREELLGRGVEVTPLRHMDLNGAGWQDGPAGPWNTFFFFKDPDGNDWAVQEKPMS